MGGNSRHDGPIDDSLLVKSQRSPDRDLSGLTWIIGRGSDKVFGWCFLLLGPEVERVGVLNVSHLIANADGWRDFWLWTFGCGYFFVMVHMCLDQVLRKLRIVQPCNQLFQLLFLICVETAGLCLTWAASLASWRGGWTKTDYRRRGGWTKTD